MKTPLQTTLEVIFHLATHSYSAAELQRRCGDISVATLKRHIAEGRELGAVIESIKFGKTWCYHLKNKDQVLPRVIVWLELEKNRTLVVS
jgi:hypothetical protein